MFYYVMIFISDWEDTATIVSRLDEVITVDTSLAHISGTIGKPTKILISNVPDWEMGAKEEKKQVGINLLNFSDKILTETGKVSLII